MKTLAIHLFLQVSESTRADVGEPSGRNVHGGTHGGARGGGPQRGQGGNYHAQNSCVQDSPYQPAFDDHNVHCDDIERESGAENEVRGGGSLHEGERG